MEQVDLPGQRYGARSHDGVTWFGFCLDCPLTGPDLPMTQAWDDAEQHWRTTHAAWVEPSFARRG